VGPVSDPAAPEVISEPPLPLPPPVVEGFVVVDPADPVVVPIGWNALSSAEQLMPTTMRQGSATDVARNIRFIRSSKNFGWAGRRYDWGLGLDTAFVP
jgi:hypothetical protein